MPTYYDKNLRKWPYISKWTLLHIPPYHCELQPIEGVWSTVLERCLDKAKEYKDLSFM
uniref:Tc1-like transposase DDE domain-containing protein n=1 Tax=Rhizophagus irregularis (strain DAOM 181602 / DAOM 197198 / MUCL 43194) TaxID=747089 RepID=U9UAI5_RHIID